MKSLFKHIEEVHKNVVPKERKAFKSLSEFQQWLRDEEDTQNVRFVRDSTRMERGNVKLIQMVCHRFHSAKVSLSFCKIVIVIVFFVFRFSLFKAWMRTNPNFVGR